MSTVEISAKVILDSINPTTGHRITTLACTFHRFILAEVNTHRQFSRNSASSRAIPVDKMLDRFRGEAAWFASWPKEQRGMQGGGELLGQDLADAQNLVLKIRDFTAQEIYKYLESHPDKSSRLHKSYLNRMMEWAQWHTALITATEWNNFFVQRLATREDGTPMAQYEFYLLADAMKEALRHSAPVERRFHTPYYDLEFVEPPLPAPYPLIDSMPEAWRSAASCARVSYDLHGEGTDIDKDMKLAHNLKGDRHWSPFEHVCEADPEGIGTGNTKGWIQMRHILSGEYKA